MANHQIIKSSIIVAVSLLFSMASTPATTENQNKLSKAEIPHSEGVNILQDIPIDVVKQMRKHLHLKGNIQLNNTSQYFKDPKTHTHKEKLYWTIPTYVSLNSTEKDFEKLDEKLNQILPQFPQTKFSLNIEMLADWNFNQYLPILIKHKNSIYDLRIKWRLKNSQDEYFDKIDGLAKIVSALPQTKFSFYTPGFYDDTAPGCNSNSADQLIPILSQYKNHIIGLDTSGGRIESQISDDSAKRLLKALQKCSNLETLYHSFNSSMDEFIEALNHWAHLESLELDINENMSPSTLEKLWASLQSRPLLKELTISDSRYFNDENAHEILKLIKNMPQLKRVWIMRQLSGVSAEKRKELKDEAKILNPNLKFF
jgi:uncharacterized protein YecE (DUF72 family)